MATIFPEQKEATFKIVYCGAPLSGKTTSLLYVHKRLDPSHRGDLISLATDEERTLFFDFLPVHGLHCCGYDTKLQLFTVPGQKEHIGNRTIVLRDADGIVFVADSSPDRVEANLEALQSTRQGLEFNGLDPDEVPFVFQYNKRDLPDALPPEQIDGYLQAKSPPILTCATTGYQIFAALDDITQIILKNFRFPDVTSRGRLDEENVASSPNLALSS